jgi:hypothetical protein
MKTENQNKKTAISQSETSLDSQHKTKKKSHLELAIELFLIDMEISSVQNDLTQCKEGGLTDQMIIVLDSYSLLLKKRNKVIKEL